MPKPACLKCQCFYRPLKNGVYVIEGAPYVLPGESAIRPPEEIRGRRRPGAWKPYKLWCADLWECPDCGHQLVAGWASTPAVVRHEDGAAEGFISRVTRDEHGRAFTINDC